MRDLRIATAQFEHRSGDKAYNLSVIEELSRRASALGADVAAFHECSVTGCICSMIIDPFGDIIAECRSLGNEVVVAACAHDKIQSSGGHRCRKARRPELYRDIIGLDNTPRQNVAWMGKQG